MMKYGVVSYLSIAIGLVSLLLFVLPLALSHNFAIALLWFSGIGVLLSLIGLFKKTEKKLIVSLALVSSACYPVTMAIIILALAG
ncbi:MAG TPA: hypothetical protein VK105_10725 [Virgibacillus sp.]|nr:hypothetical protein [Virgibacillus sp.]HLR67583.1 hypothetical protein [Virgibacillus sp.]